jgi:hypothetical protein
MRESRNRASAKSNFRAGKSAIKEILSPAERISFRDLARLARKRKTDFWLSERTGADTRTVLRWMSRETRAPDHALGVVLGEIMRRYG